jgi:hypothetical protein
MIQPARPSQLKSFFNKNKLPACYRGYRHNIGRRAVISAPSNIVDNNNNMKKINNNDQDRPKSSPYSRPSTTSSTSRNQHNCIADTFTYNKLKREMEKQVDINTKQNKIIAALEKKVKSLQSKLLIERNENEQLRNRVNETILVNEMADAYLRSLLQQEKSK